LPRTLKVADSKRPGFSILEKLKKLSRSAMGVRENSVAFEDTSAASLYQELNFKIATSQAFIDKMKHTAKRRARVNYLARKTPYVLSELLDHKYWKTHEMWFRTDLDTIRA
jgi:hypothetical protein